MRTPCQIEVASFGDHDLDAERAGQGSLQLFGMRDLDDPVAALALSGQIGPVVGDQMRRGALFLP
jgi:hypothetical protein